MNLRTLAKEYAGGLLGIQAYRKARDELIEGILVGRLQVTKNDFQAPLRSQRAEAAPDITAFRAPPLNKPVSKSSVTITEPKTDKAHTPSIYRAILAGIAVIIVSLVILVALYPVIQQKISVSDITNQAISSGPSGAESDAQHPFVLTAGEGLIRQFLAQNEWDDENLQHFIKQWQELSAEEQDAGLSSPVKSQLANAIHRKLLDERAMLSLGDIQNSVDKQTVLVNFARQIGINDPRLTVQETP